MPVAELVCLARHLEYRGQGLGDSLLFKVFENVISASHLLGIAGIQLAYTPEGKILYDRYDFEEHSYGESLLFIPINKIRLFLPEDTRSQGNQTNAGA